MARALPWMVCVAALGGACRGADGNPCRLDSDCVPGLVCGLDGLCQSRASVDRGFHPPDADIVPAEATSSVDSGDAGDALAHAEYEAGDPAACGPVGVFEPATAPCPSPASKRTVTSLVLPDSGHGMAGLAVLANPVIANGFEAKTLAYEAWVDGGYATSCGPAIAWMRAGQPDRQENCTAVWLTEFPFAIPGLVEATIYQAVLDPSTDRLSGLADEEEILGSMDPSLRPTADNLLSEDVDTDGDQVPDKVSVLIDVGFAGLAPGP